MPPPRTRLPGAALFCILLAAGSAAATAQDAEPAEIPGEISETDPSDGAARHGIIRGFTGQAVLLCIDARIMEKGREVSWSKSHTQATIPGHPVEIKLVGDNVVVAVQFTPYIRRGGDRKFLVAQGRVWMDTPDRGILYQASMQTIHVHFGEPVYFFPLGPVRDDDPSIEVVLTIYPYEE
jgi:hypothetical protein